MNRKLTGNVLGNSSVTRGSFRKYLFTDRATMAMLSKLALLHALIKMVLKKMALELAELFGFHRALFRDFKVSTSFYEYGVL